MKKLGADRRKKHSRFKKKSMMTIKIEHDNLKCWKLENAQRMLHLFDTNGDDCLNRSEFRLMLKSFDPFKRGPLPIHFEWAWKLADQDNDGLVHLDDLIEVLPKYEERINANPTIEDLIRRYDTNGDGCMSESGLASLLQQVTGRTISMDDIDTVLAEVNRIGSLQIHRRYRGNHWTDPDILSRAISHWYFDHGERAQQPHAGEDRPSARRHAWLHAGYNVHHNAGNNVHPNAGNNVYHNAGNNVPYNAVHHDVGRVLDPGRGLVLVPRFAAAAGPGQVLVPPPLPPPRLGEDYPSGIHQGKDSARATSADGPAAGPTRKEPEPEFWAGLLSGITCAAGRDSDQVGCGCRRGAQRYRF